jgi:hypothetical protein
MQNKILYLALICLFTTDIKAQFNSSKYDDYDKHEFDNKIIYSVKLNNKWGIVDDKGKQLIPVENDKIERIFKGLKKTEPLIMVKKNELLGVLNLKNNFVIPLSNWYDLKEDGLLIIAVKKGPTEKNSNRYYPLDTSYVYNKAGLEIMKTHKHYNLKYIEIDTCITKNIYIKAKLEASSWGSYDFRYDSFIIEPGKSPRIFFKNSSIDLWPDKMFYVVSEQKEKNLNRKAAAFYSLKGEIITNKGDYTSICCKSMYPRYIANQYTGKYDKNGRYEEGLDVVIDTAGNKLSEGFKPWVVRGMDGYDSDGYFYKIYSESSVTPLCPTITPTKSINQTNSKAANKKPIIKAEPIETVVKLNKFEDVLISVQKSTIDGRDFQEAIIDFNGKMVCGWYFRILDLRGKYYYENNVYGGGNLRVLIKGSGGETKEGIFSLVSKKEILPPLYDRISLFSDGIYNLQNNGKYGLWFQKENKFIDTVYDNLDEYPTRVKLNGVWGKIEKLAFVPF